MPPLGQVNVVHNLGMNRLLHCISVPGEKMTRLRKACAKTSFAATHQNLEDFFDNDMTKILCQTNDVGPRQIVKGLDGHVVVVVGRNGEQRIQSVIRDPVICQPEGIQKKDLKKGIVHCYVVVHPPKEVAPPFLLREGHMGVLPADHISSFSPVDHIVGQLGAAIPLDVNIPRVIFEAGNLGRLKAVMLKGEIAHAVKTSFLKLMKQTRGDMFDMPIEMTPMLSNALMLNNPTGCVCCAKLKNGIIGYRERADGGKTFVFVCNSDDFFHDEPTNDVEQSILQVFKMSYNNKNVEGDRIHIEISGNEYNNECPCRYNTPVIRCDMTVQDVLNIIEYACRNAMLTHMGCADYPMHWHARKVFENEQFRKLRQQCMHLSKEQIVNMINSNKFNEGEE